MKKIVGLSLSTLVAAAICFPAGASTSDSFLKRTMVRASANYDVPTDERTAYAVRPTVAGARGETFFVEPTYHFGGTFGIEHAFVSESSYLTSAVLDYNQYSTHRDQTAFGGDSIIIPIGAANAGRVNTGSIAYRDSTWRLGVRRAKEFGGFDWQGGAFAEYTRLTRTQNITSTIAGIAQQLYQRDESKAWGPSFDLLGRAYLWGRNTGFSLFASGEAAFLYADQDYNVIQTTNGVFVVGVRSNGNRDSTKAMITRLGGSAGLSYAQPISEDLMVGFRLGGRWSDYYNAFKHTSNLTDGRTDYGRVGPFVEVRVGGTHSPMN